MELKDAIQRALDESRSREAARFDPTATLLEWKTEVKVLFDDIRTWLRPFITAGQVRVKEHGIKISEDLLGDYGITMLELTVGDVDIRAEPKGRIVVGARGRVDLYRLGSAREPYILLLSEEAGMARLVWYEYNRKTAHRRKLKEPLFHELLAELLAGGLD